MRIDPNQPICDQHRTGQVLIVIVALPLHEKRIK
jgi:hypothetical protein